MFLMNCILVLQVNFLWKRIYFILFSTNSWKEVLTTKFLDLWSLPTWWDNTAPFGIVWWSRCISKFNIIYLSEYIIYREFNVSKFCRTIYPSVCWLSMLATWRSSIVTELLMCLFMVLIVTDVFFQKFLLLWRIYLI